MPGYGGVGAAFTGGMEDYLAKRAAEDRQQMLDRLKIRQEDRQEKRDAETFANQAEDRKERHLEHLMKIEDRRADAQEKAKKEAQTQYDLDTKDLVPGDMPTPDMLRSRQGAHDFPEPAHTGSAFPPEQPPPGVTGPAIPISGVAAGAPPIATGSALRIGSTPPPAGVSGPSIPSMDNVVSSQAPDVRPFIGSPVQRATAQHDREAQARADRIGTMDPESPEFRKELVRDNILTNKPLTSGFIPKPPTEGAVGIANYSLPGVGPIVAQHTKAGRIVYKGEDVTDRVRPYVSPQTTVVVQTPDGPMVADRGAHTATPLMGPDGQPIGAPISGTTRIMMEGATMLKPHVARVDQLGQELDKRGLFGPVASRMRDALAKVGTINAGDFDGSSEKLQQFAAEFNQAVDADPKLSTDALVGQFATELGLLASGAGRVHGGARGGGSIQMIDYMKSMLSSSSSYQMFHGRMTGLDSYMSGYAKGPKGGGSNAEPATTPKPLTADELIKKYGG